MFVTFPGERKLDDISRNDQILLPIEREKFAVHLRGEISLVDRVKPMRKEEEGEALKREKEKSENCWKLAPCVFLLFDIARENRAADAR